MSQSDASCSIDYSYRGHLTYLLFIIPHILVHREGCKDPEQETAAFINGNLQNMANMFGSPNVIKANNPEVCKIS